MKLTRLPVAILLTGAALYSAPAAAQGLNDNFWVEADFYWPNVDSTVQVSSVTDDTVGTRVDFEDDLNLEKGEALPSFSAGARLSHSWRLAAEYFSLNRSGTVTSAREIVFDDVTYPVAAELTSEFDSDVFRFVVGWSFYRTEQVEVGAALGLHATDFAIALEGEGTVGNQAASFESRRREVLAPLPTIGAYANIEVAPGLELGGSIDWLSLKVGDYDGRLTNLQAKLAYRVLENVGVGVSYRLVDYRLDVTKEDYVGRLTYEFSGPSVFLVLGF